MAEEAWLSGKLDGFSPVMMPAAHALRQAIVDLKKAAADLSDDELFVKPNGASSVAFHLRHISGSVDRLLTYAKNENLSDAQFEFLKSETAETSGLNARELVNQTVSSIENALEFCRTVSEEILLDERFVGRKRLPTNVFGLLFHIAEHTARHTGQVITLVRIVRK
ncbi:MAG TPA: DinB family protein [Pyrinomonadaceae bacterium]|nr:DinB family protein [Pyrinomonadaceae bacterium]